MAVPYNAQQQQQVIQCPNCGSEHVSKLSVVYRHRLPALETTAVQKYRTSVLSGSHVPERDPALLDLAPPRRASYLFIFLVGLGFVLLGFLLGATRWFMTLWASGWGIAVLVLWFGAYRYNTERWPQKMAAWKQTLLCHECGERFIVPQDEDV